MWISGARGVPKAGTPLAFSAFFDRDVLVFGTSLSVGGVERGVFHNFTLLVATVCFF